MITLHNRVAILLVCICLGACKSCEPEMPKGCSPHGVGSPPIGSRDHLATSVGLNMLPVLAGVFQLGTEGHPTWENPHRVTITHDYWIAETEVTQQQWEKVMGTQPWGHSGPIGDDSPATGITWHDANEFCKGLDRRERSLGNIPAGYVIALPSEAEWEIACRAGSASAFHFGDDISSLSEYAVWRGNSDGRAAPVKSKTPNRYGIYDMHGNVWEWCADAFADTPENAVDPIANEGAVRAVRGGAAAWEAKYCRSASRDCHGPTRAFVYVGFRPAVVRR